VDIAIFSGEVSGDLIGGALAREILRLHPDAKLWGVGSDSMRAAGVELIADSATWGAISVTEAVTKVPNLLLRVAPSISLDMMRDYLTDHAEIRDRLSDLWHEFAQEAESKVWKPVQRTASALTPQGQRKMVTVGGVVVSEDAFKKRLEDQKREAARRTNLGLPPIVLAKGLTYEVMAHSDVLLTCSGTATLEAALFETPMVILYRGSKLMEIEYYMRGLHKTIPHIGLPNVLADSRIVPELIQKDATPEAIAEHALKMLNDPETRHRVKTDLRALRNTLGKTGASERAARLILEIAAGSQ
jgi:lipid A disaccharide synthetase